MALDGAAKGNGEKQSEQCVNGHEAAGQRPVVGVIRQQHGQYHRKLELLEGGQKKQAQSEGDAEQVIARRPRPRASRAAHNGASLQRCKVRAEVSQQRGLLDDAIACHGVSSVEHVDDRLDHVIDVTLGVNTPRNGEPHELIGSRLLPAAAGIRVAEHDAANFDRAYARFPVQFHRQGNAGIRQGCYLRAEAGGIRDSRPRGWLVV